MVENCVIVEIKAVEVVLPVTKLTYGPISGSPIPLGFVDQLQCAIDQKPYHRDGVVNALSVPLW